MAASPCDHNSESGDLELCHVHLMLGVLARLALLTCPDWSSLAAMLTCALSPSSADCGHFHMAVGGEFTLTPPSTLGQPGVIGDTLGLLWLAVHNTMPCDPLLLQYFWLPALDQNTKDLQNFQVPLCDTTMHCGLAVFRTPHPCTSSQALSIHCPSQSNLFQCNGLWSPPLTQGCRQFGTLGFTIGACG